jgi:hypothetical protein
MPQVPPFHTVEPGKPHVYHNNAACHDAHDIKPPHLRPGTGTDRRLCEECARLNQLGQ